MIALESVRGDHYRSPPAGPEWPRVFGGQLLGEALLAAGATVDPARAAHSLHAHFCDSGDSALPIDYRVERIRDGRSFSSRQVGAWQGERRLLLLAASFHAEEAGLAHQRHAPPDVPPPDGLADERTLLLHRLADVADARRLHVQRERLIEFRPIDPDAWLADDPRDPVQAYWVRSRVPLPRATPLLRRALLAYASDHLLLSTGLIAHGFDWLRHEAREASLDHALWFHADPAIDEWMLYVVESPWAGQARMLNRGQFFDRRGKLIASVAQEGLIRIS